MSEIEAELENNPVENGTSISEPESVSDDRVNMTQAELVELLKRKSEKAFQKGREQVMQEMNQQNSAATNVQQPTQAAPVDTEQLKRQIIEQMQLENKQAEQARLQDTLQRSQYEFVNRIGDAADKYPNLSKDVQDLMGVNDHANQALIYAMVNFDNTADMMQELASNTSKYHELLNDLQRSPEMAKRKLQALSNSIKVNQQALANAQTAEDEPLTRIQNSMTGNHQDSGASNVSYMEKLIYGR